MGINTCIFFSWAEDFGLLWPLGCIDMEIRKLMFKSRNNFLYKYSYINTMKTTFEFNFSFKLNSMDTHKHKIQENLSIQFSLITYTCKLLIRKKLVNNQNLNKKVVFIVVIIAYHRSIKCVYSSRLHFVFTLIWKYSWF